MTYKCCQNWNSWSFGDPVLYHPKWIQCDVLKTITLSLSPHTIRSVNNNTWRHWKDPQTSLVNKCSIIFLKCLTGTKLRIAKKNPRKINNHFGNTPYWDLTDITELKKKKKSTRGLNLFYWILQLPATVTSDNKWFTCMHCTDETRWGMYENHFWRCHVALGWASVTVRWD